MRKIVAVVGITVVALSGAVDLAWAKNGSGPGSSAGGGNNGNGNGGGNGNGQGGGDGGHGGSGGNGGHGGNGGGGDNGGNGGGNGGNGGGGNSGGGGSTGSGGSSGGSSAGSTGGSTGGAASGSGASVSTGVSTGTSVSGANGAPTINDGPAGYGDVANLVAAIKACEMERPGLAIGTYRASTGAWSFSTFDDTVWPYVYRCMKAHGYQPNGVDHSLSTNFGSRP